MNRRLVLSALVGLLHAVVVYVNGYVLLDLTLDATGFRLVAYKSLQFLGLFAVGASATYLLLRFGLVSPIALTALLTLFSLRDHVSASMESFTPLYIGLWFVALALVAVAAVAEYGVRSVLGVWPVGG